LTGALHPQRVGERDRPGKPVYPLVNEPRRA
jgi:hypothetical protein